MKAFMFAFIITIIIVKCDTIDDKRGLGMVKFENETKQSEKLEELFASPD